MRRSILHTWLKDHMIAAAMLAAAAGLSWAGSACVADAAESVGVQSMEEDSTAAVEAAARDRGLGTAA